MNHSSVEALIAQAQLPSAANAQIATPSPPGVASDLAHHMSHSREGAGGAGLLENIQTMALPRPDLGLEVFMEHGPEADVPTAVTDHLSVAPSPSTFLKMTNGSVFQTDRVFAASISV